MPRIRSFDNCEIRVYFMDHLPPHFHILDKGGREWLVRIDDGTILAGPRDARIVRVALEWAAAEENSKLLMRRFMEYRR